MLKYCLYRAKRELRKKDLKEQQAHSNIFFYEDSNCVMLLSQIFSSQALLAFMLMRLLISFDRGLKK